VGFSLLVTFSKLIMLGAAYSWKDMAKRQSKPPMAGDCRCYQELECRCTVVIQDWYRCTDERTAEDSKRR